MIHGVVELNAFRLKLGMEDFEGAGEFPFGSHLCFGLDAVCRKHKAVSPLGTRESIMESSLEKERMSSTSVF